MIKKNLSASSPYQIQKCLKEANDILLDQQNLTEETKTINSLNQIFEKLQELRKQLQASDINVVFKDQKQGSIPSKEIQQEQMDEYLIRQLELEPPQASEGYAPKRRGKYAQYSKQIKQQAVQYHIRDGYSFNKISKMMNIPVKNISRWSNKGIERVKGAGRDPLDTSMETELLRWIKQQFNQGQQIDSEVIKKQAKKLSHHKKFCASQGWFKNFTKRWKIDGKFVFKKNAQMNKKTFVKMQEQNSLNNWNHQISEDFIRYQKQLSPLI